MKVSIKQCKYLEGKIKISGSKNSVLPIMAISLLTRKKMKLTNVPLISDVYNMIHLLKYLGVGVKLDYNNNTITLKRKRVRSNLLCQEATKLRASYYLYPGMIHHNKKSIVTFPGGCNFSKRPINYHLDIFKKTGVIVNTKENLTFLKKKLKRAIFDFPTPSVGATINALLHSVLIKGITVIKNQPIEPEVQDVINCLNQMGADIKTNNKDIIIKGVKKLKKVTYQIMPDRIELGSFLLLASIIPSNIILANVLEESVTYLDSYLKKLGIHYIYNNNQIMLKTTGKINNINIQIKPYPAFPTDLQPILSAVLLSCDQQSIIVDEVYQKRISHLNEIKKMDGNIEYDKGRIIINPSCLRGSNVVAHDLRCGFGLIICGCLAKGTTYIDNFEIVNRGYENVIAKLKALGVQINEV